ncbi:MAG: hypothetical protein RL638_24 [Bacteroidota bacterium]|jgi:uncharacterized protein (DUF1501 family)
MKRRDFIHNFSHAVAAGAILPNFNYLEASKKYALLENTVDPGKILIVLNFSGGNDGLNMITPMDQYANLDKVRPHVIIPEKKLIQLGKNDLAFHPEFKDMKVLFDEKRLKIIQNVGYTTADFSHFRSSDIWQSASDFNQFVTSGWLGRLAEHEHPAFPESYPNSKYPDPLAIELGYSNSLLLTGVNSFPGFIPGSPENINNIVNEFDNDYPNTYTGDKLNYIQIIAKQSNLYSSVVRDAYIKGNHNIQFPNGDLGGQFYKLSRLIRGGLNTRIYHATIGGFDTHDYQVSPDDHTKGPHANLLTNVNDSIIALMKCLDQTGDSDRIMLVTYSEFGRRIASRGSGGTDHGTAFPMMIFGNNLNANVLGKNPKIDPKMTWEDNLDAEFDFRQIYASVIEQWLGGDNATIKDVLTKSYNQVGLTKEYADDDMDGVLDKEDKCLNTPLGAMVDTNGCEVFTLSPDAISVTASSTSCIGQKNGSILISTINKNFSYTILIGDTNAGVLNKANNYSQKIENLSVGSYTITLRVDGVQNYERKYEVKIGEPAALNAITSVDSSKSILNIKLSGSDTYFVNLNGDQKESAQSKIELPLVKGLNSLRITTNKDCQGAYNEEIFLSEEVNVSPNPTPGPVKIYIPGNDSVVEVKINNMMGSMILQTNQTIPYTRMLDLDLSNLSAGTYLIKLSGNTVRTVSKLVKY